MSNNIRSSNIISFKSSIDFKKILTMLILLFYFLFSSQTFSQEKENKSILIIYSFSHLYPATTKWDRTMRQILKGQEDIKVNISAEHLDLSRYNDPDYFQMMKDVFRYKYSKSKPDLIITVFEPALDFIKRYHKDLFPNVPVVFGGVERNSVNNFLLDSNFTGVYQGANSFKKTLDLALDLHPRTSSAVVISGGGSMEQAWLKPAQIVFQEYEDRLDFKYLSGLSLNEILTHVEKLPSNTIVLYFPVLEDKAGKTYIAVEVLSKISEVSNVPIYSFWDIFLGHGALGGYLKSFPEQAKKTAEMGISILKNIPQIDISHTQRKDLQYMFDWRELKRWSVPESKLPTNSIIMYKEYTFWEKYFGRIIIILALLLIQTVIIGYMLIQKRMNRRSQIELLEAEQKYRTVADYTFDWEYWQNSDGSLQYVSPSCERITGYNIETFMKKPSMIGEIVIQEDKVIWDDHLCHSQEEKKSEGIQFRIQKSNGDIRWIEHTCQPVIDDHGTNLGVRASNRDITVRVRYKSEMQKLQSELMHMERITTISTLTYALAHEINQPLTSIRSYAQAALRFMDKEEPEDDNIRKALNGIVADNKRAAAVINQLRDLVKKETVKRDKLKINSIINDVLNLMNSVIVFRNTSIKLDLDQKKALIYGDPIQIQQVLINLLTNALDAIEENDADMRTINISTRFDDSQGFIISISDSGIGIANDKLNEIFEPFHSSKSKGIGLGLALCKLIVESHQGKIWAENNTTRGSTFSILLPVEE